MDFFIETGKHSSNTISNVQTLTFTYLDLDNIMCTSIAIGILIASIIIGRIGK